MVIQWAKTFETPYGERGCRAVSSRCGGGVAPLEMAHALIAERMGEAFARRVSDWFLHTAIGAADDPQRASAVERYGVHHPALLAVLETMEKTVEAPLGRLAMARLAAISPRHLDRLFLEARHTAALSIDENGASAAATTVLAAGGIVQHAVRADRPFLWVIRERSTGAIVLLGRVVEPVLQS